ncbi:MAG TPA: ferritin-like domain-containing protein [Iamia sp.]|nr:ferritin-like domain-containing protein [Iamia sp.]
MEVATDDAVLAEARRALVRMLQDAHAGELAAAFAYRAHSRSLRRRHPDQAHAIQVIEAAEWHHRNRVAEMLEELGEQPRRPRELLMGTIGTVFGSLCWVSGWFGPMYAAGRLEAMNVGQYDTAAGDATTLGLPTMVVDLEAMRVEEQRHEDYFAGHVRGHPLLPIAAFFLSWSPTP